MELEVYNIKGEKTGRMAVLSDEVFGIDPNDHAIYLDVKQHMANKRQGTHKAKERSEVKGSTRKLKRQKGTGTARVGDIKNPLFRGGGRVFGPRPRDYSFKLNKKLKRLARISALSYKAKENGITIMEDLSFSDHKTRNFVQMISNLSLYGKKVLVVMAEPERNVVIAARNIQKTKVIRASDLNTYDVLNASAVLLEEKSLPLIEQHHVADIISESK